MVETRDVVAAYKAIDDRLFSNSRWLADRHRRAELDAIDGREQIPELLAVFAGFHDPIAIPASLERWGLISYEAAHDLYDRLEQEDDMEGILRPVVQQAFRDYYNPGGWLN